VFGVAMFSVALGMGRTLYARIGKRITRVLLWGAVGAAVCYLTATLAPLPILGLLGCAFTGFCVSMLWPGSLIVASDRYPTAGVMIFALMAAGGDLGASFGPQMVGIVTDLALTSPRLLSLASKLAIAPEQLGMKLGLLIATLFSLIAIPVYLRFAKWARDKKTETTEM
jgi:MFS family permease